LKTVVLLGLAWATMLYLSLLYSSSSSTTW
jgi:hypothetical protein